MALAPGTRIGPYDVLGPIGAGGMGEVYRARDTRLGREVALKTLPDSFAADADRLRRFEQEAKSTGALNHPNILAVYDVGAHGDAPYVVSELLEGETLRERLGGTPLPARKAVDFAVQIARGLAAAHDKGIVHRDLKPDNVFVTRDGRVKILDFGLAKVVAAADPQAETRTNAAVPQTDAGVVLGTVGYMSPEQVRAKPVDHRSDIFSFGAVLYEMLTGRRAFRGTSAVETMNAILKEDPPPLSAANGQVPPLLERMVAHCLEKNPDERFQSARDIAFDLEQLSSTSTSTAGLVSPAPWRRALSFAGGAAVLALVLAAGWLLARARAAPLVTFKPITFQNGWAQDARFTPDGRQVVYQAQWPGMRPDVYVTQIGSPESRALGVEAIRLLAVGPGGDLLVRRLDNALAQVPMGGGAPRDLMANVEEASWDPDGTQIAVLHGVGARARLEYPIGHTLHESVSMRFPRVAPSGQLVAFTEHPFLGDFRGDVAVVDLQGRMRTLSAGWSDIRGLAWSADGKEVWFTGTRLGAESSLWAVTLDGTLRHVFDAPGSLALHDVAPDGRVVLSVQRRRPRIFGLAKGAGEERDLSWLDYGTAADLSRDGRTLLFAEQGEGGGPEYTAYLRGMDGSLPVRLGKGGAIALSPDGRDALVVDLAEPMQLRLLPTGAGSGRTLPRGPLVQIQGASFLGDGRRVALCGSEPGKPSKLYVQDVAGGEPRLTSEEEVFAPNTNLPSTADGAFVVASAEDGRLRLFPTSAGAAARPVPGSQPGDVPVQFSGDGRWLYVVAPFATGQESAWRRGAVSRDVVRIDLQSGAREPWRAIGRDVGNPAAFVGNVVLSADASSLAYTFRDDSSTLYVAEGLK